MVWPLVVCKLPLLTCFRQMLKNQTKKNPQTTFFHSYDWVFVDIADSFPSLGESTLSYFRTCLFSLFLLLIKSGPVWLLDKAVCPNKIEKLRHLFLNIEKHRKINLSYDSAFVYHCIYFVRKTLERISIKSTELFRSKSCLCISQ